MRRPPADTHKTATEQAKSSLIHTHGKYNKILQYIQDDKITYYTITALWLGMGNY